MRNFSIKFYDMIFCVEKLMSLRSQLVLLIVNDVDTSTHFTLFFNKNSFYQGVTWQLLSRWWSSDTIDFDSFVLQGEPDM